MNLFRIGISFAKSALSKEQYESIRSRLFSLFAGYHRKRFARVSEYDNFHCFLLPKDLPKGIHDKQFFSQRGQDWFLSTYVFPGVNKGFFLDIGANHPFDLSNTCYFEKLGWTGIAFEPQPHVQALWENARKTPCLQLALGDTEGTVLFNSIIADNWTHALAYMNSVDEDRRMLLEELKEPHKVQQIQVEQKKLETVLQENGIKEIDFISMDVEGYEMNVLKGIDFSRVLIKCFVIENDATCIGDDAIRNFLKGKGYTHIARLSGDDVFVHASHLNTIR